MSIFFKVTKFVKKEIIGTNEDFATWNCPRHVSFSNALQRCNRRGATLCAMHGAAKQCLSSPAPITPRGAAVHHAAGWRHHGGGSNVACTSIAARTNTVLSNTSGRICLAHDSERPATPYGAEIPRQTGLPAAMRRHMRGLLRKHGKHGKSTTPKGLGKRDAPKDAPPGRDTWIHSRVRRPLSLMGEVKARHGHATAPPIAQTGAATAFY